MEQIKNYEIRDVSNQNRSSMVNLSIGDVDKWLYKNRYDLFGLVIARGMESWDASDYLRYKTTL